MPPLRAAAAILPLCFTLVAAAQAPPPQTASTAQPNHQLDQLKKDLAAEIDSGKDFTQQMVDQVFSFGELGFQEFETSKYLTAILRRNGFAIEDGVAGIPTAWTATWGSGKPVIALGSDVDCIPRLRRSLASPTTIRLSKARPDTAKATTPGCR